MVQKSGLPQAWNGKKKDVSETHENVLENFQLFWDP